MVRALPTEDNHEVTCLHCYRKLLYEESDRYKIPNGWGITCPFCNSLVRTHTTNGHTYPIDFTKHIYKGQADNKTINYYIDKLLANNSPCDWRIDGDSIVIQIQDEDGNQHIFVSHNYQDVTIEEEE